VGSGLKLVEVDWSWLKLIEVGWSWLKLIEVGIFLLKFVKWVDVDWSWLRLVNLDLLTKITRPEHMCIFFAVHIWLIYEQNTSTICFTNNKNYIFFCNNGHETIFRTPINTEKYFFSPKKILSSVIVITNKRLH